jgi:hypothetical protein
MKCQNKFWLNNPPDLLCSFSILPMTSMDLDEQMNAATRLVIIIFLIFLLIDFKKAIYFLITAIIIIIILYYIQRKAMNKTENFIKRNMPYSTVENFESCSIPTQNRVNNINCNYFEPQTSDICGPPCSRVGFGQKVPGENLNAKIVYRTSRDLASTFCNDATPTGSGPDFYSRNNALSGQANPRTLINPIITPRSHDLDYWRANNLVIHSHINAESNHDLYQSGYEVSNCCGNVNKELKYKKSKIPGRAPVLTIAEKKCKPVEYGEIIDNNFEVEREYINNFENQGDFEANDNLGNNSGLNTGNNSGLNTGNNSGLNTGNNSGLNTGNNSGLNTVENFTQLPIAPGCRDSPRTNLSSSYSYPYESTNIPQSEARVLGENNIRHKKLGPLRSGMMNISCGYNESNVCVNLPTNDVAGMCPRDEAYSEYNKNLYTQTIQPGVYSQSQINEPLNSNIGISFQQQFSPVTCQSNNDGVFYTLNDPRIIEPITPQTSGCYQQDSEGNNVNRSNIYDPRFNGYGTSYRSYTDPLTGQTRYNYDDINLIKQPNYITRNKIDIYSFADRYGPAKPQFSLGAVKALAGDAWTRASIQQRNDLMERYMSGKNNTRQAQLRKAPIHTSTSSGACNRCK